MITFDWETWPSIGGAVPGACTPRGVCVAFYDGRSEPRLYHRDDHAWYSVLLSALDGVVGNQTIGFDFRVSLREAFRISVRHAVTLRRKIFHAYYQGRIINPQVIAMLGSIALGEPMSLTGRQKRKLEMFSLADLCERYLGRKVAGKKGDDIWRLRYHELDAVPVHLWPLEAIEYPKDDVRNAYDVIGALREAYGTPAGEARNVRAAWALQLAESWGVRSDPAYVEALKRHLMREITAAKADIRKVGGWIRSDDSQNRKLFHARIEAAYRAIGEEPERNEPTDNMLAKGETVGSISGERPILQALIDRSPPGSLPDLQRWIDIGRMQTDLSTFVDPVESGAVLPVNARWNVLVESERLSCRKPNLTNQPTHTFTLPDGRKVGIRPCFVPRHGWVYVLTDYSTAELRSLAQVTYSRFGASAMRDALIAEHNAKQRGEPALDLHAKFACRILNVDEATGLRMVVEDDPRMMAKPFGARDIAKRCNFGLAGFMFARTFALTALKEKFDLTMGGKLGSDPVTVAGWLRDAWLETWPEMPWYFKWNQELIASGGGVYTSVKSWSVDGDGIVRGNVKITDLCNHWFQNLVARMIKESLWLCCYEAYNDESSPLWGCRPVIAPHDEIVSEAPAHRAHEAAVRQAAIMEAVACRVCPDVPHAVEPAIARRWYKGASPVFDNHKRLIPWEPK